MPRRPELFLQDIITELRFLDETVRDRDVEDILDDQVLRKAIERSLEIIGEAAKAFPIEMQALYPSVPWSGMARTRDLMIHAYHRIDPLIVWKTVVEFAVPLLPVMESTLADLLERREET